MMSLKQKFVAALCGAALTPIVALCQETSTYKSEVNVEGFLPIVKSATASDVQQSTSLNGGVIAGYRLFFGTHSGFEVTSFSKLAIDSLQPRYRAARLRNVKRRGVGEIFPQVPKKSQENFSIGWSQVRVTFQSPERTIEWAAI